MKLFGLNLDEFGPSFSIEKKEQDWVEEALLYLIEVVGLPDKDSKWVLLDTDFFPKTILETEAKMEDVLQELCPLLELDAVSIQYAFYDELEKKEVDDSSDEISREFEIDTQFFASGPKIYLRRKLLKTPKKLIFLLLYELLQIRLVQNSSAYKPQKNMGPFMSLAGIFLGFGILVSRNLFSAGDWNAQFWESKWFKPATMTDDAMAYSLALYTRMRKERQPEWKVLLPDSLRALFDKALRSVKKVPIPFEQSLKFKIAKNLRQASFLYKQKDYAGASLCLEELTENHPDEPIPERVFNNQGYYQTLAGEFKKSIKSFKKALELQPEGKYIHDNLGYAHIQLGQLKKGREYIMHSLKEMKNDIAYSFRNLAVYHHAKGELKKAEEFFDLSYENITRKVDLLDYHYALFLLESGKKKKGMKYLQKSVAKGEPIAIKKLQELKNDS